ncbi:MAG: hypothetical protein UT24_C0009G0117 [Candidatus Woesebacteria bacterium GW2011_GWB1_39_12]|uniref:Uncharacterized protein n=2 Tax=Candidatus Woeseibacteriota TaxID=1752722 RepID=A0A0G0ME86_9BACT|nr:MAG: hypothetical protein UT23_C0002G0115 [Candidatus Woesebacteria bacterium GW2011_GWA1_39_12]KKR00800.1 MAG: hypothetical protein UT24_C0009G0117 [Candidatus Woesebacteria bacterium GW2011_GWB1_39_12]
MTDREYLIALYAFIYFGPARTNLLIQYFGSAKDAWNANSKSLVEIGLKKNIVEDFGRYKRDFNSQEYFDRLKKHSIDVITINDDSYPENLRDLDDAPLVLYIRGKLSKNDTNSVAIVGSRKMTSYGREVTQKLSSELASLGITIVSGLAFGVDLEAHKSVLSVGGRCVAVLASGVDELTPRSNEWLGLEIIKTGGAIVSEFPPGTEAQRYFFPFRNRIISGLSKAVIVVEGMIKSGTIHTAKHAAEQGRTVFAVPGQITSPMSAASHYLIKNGAKMVTSVNDILEELDLQLKVDRDAVNKVMPTDADEKKIIEILTNEPLHLDECARISGLKVSEISGKLTVMELKGIVKNIGNGVYKKV